MVFFFWFRDPHLISTVDDPDVDGVGFYRASIRLSMDGGVTVWNICSRAMPSSVSLWVHFA